MLLIAVNMNRITNEKNHAVGTVENYWNLNISLAWICSHLCMSLVCWFC